MAENKSAKETPMKVKLKPEQMVQSAEEAPKKVKKLPSATKVKDVHPSEKDQQVVAKKEQEERDVIVSMKHVQIGFKRGTKTRVVIDDLNLDIYRGEIFGLVGESGSGKTTIGRALIRIVPTLSGTILFNGVKINGNIGHRLDRHLKTQIQMIYQDPTASLNERANIDYIISEGLRAFHLYKNESDRLKKVSDMMIRVGLRPEHLKRFPHEFSGGQRQRIGIARSMIMDPTMIIADEPISALDVSIRAQILNLIQEFRNEKKMTVLFIAHDLSVVKYISDRIGVIFHGQIVEIAHSERLFELPLHPYTQSLLTAIPIPDPHIEKNKSIRVYTGDQNEASTKLVEVEPDHFVRGTEEQIENYKKLAKAAKK